MLRPCHTRARRAHSVHGDHRDRTPQRCEVQYDNEGEEDAGVRRINITVESWIKSITKSKHTINI